MQTANQIRSGAPENGVKSDFSIAAGCQLSRTPVHPIAGVRRDGLSSYVCTVDRR